MKKKILFGILFYLLDDVLEKCLESLENEIKKIKLENYEILIAANSFLKLKKKYKNLKIIQNSENLKFAKTSNQIFRYALKKNFDLIFLINKDTIFLKDSIKNLLQATFLINKEFIISPIQLDKNNQIDKKSLSLYKQTKGKINCQIQEIKFINAACWLIHINILKEVGGFNELFYHYGNDNDYIKRIRKKKFFHGVITNSKITHTRIFSKTNHITQMRIDSEVSSKVYSYILHSNHIIIGLYLSLRYLFKMILFNKVRLKYFFKILGNILKVIPYRGKIKIDL